MLKKLAVTLTIFGTTCIFFIANGLFAGTTVPDVIKLESKVYKKHKKGLVEFSHKKHSSDYGATCGDCHHDKNGKPLTLKMEDDVHKCSECHKDTGKIPKKIKKKEKIKQFHKSAMHENCKACHKKHNKSKGLKKKDKDAAPLSCKQCHPKK